MAFIRSQLVMVFVVLLFVACRGKESKPTDQAKVVAPISAPTTTTPGPRPVPQLEQAKPISGWVVDGVGKPIEGVEIRPTVIAGQKNTEEALAVTDASGAFRFATPPAEGSELRLQASAIFSATFRFQGSDVQAQVMATRRMLVRAKVMRGGRLVVGAEVELNDGSLKPRIVLSDAQGLASFDELVPGVYALWAHDKNSASPLVQVVRFTSDTTVVKLEMLAASSASGRVVGEAGEGLPASITLSPVSGDHAIRQVQAGPDGHFAVSSLVPGRWRVTAEVLGYVTNADYELLVGSAPATIAMRLRKGGGIVGRVLDAEGTFVPNAHLVLRGKSKLGKSDSSAVKSLLASRWIHPLAGTRKMPIRDSRRFGATRNGARPAECGGGHCGVDIGTTMGSGVHAVASAIVVTISRENQGPAGRYVTLEHPAGIKTFYMHLDEIRDDLVVGGRVRAGELLGTVGRTGVLRSGPHLHFAMSHQQAGRTWFVDPEPILQHAVVLPVGEMPSFKVASEIIQAKAQGAKETQAPTTLRSDADGYFRIQGLTPGSYHVLAFHTEFASGTSKPFVIRSGQTTESVQVVLALGTHVRGKVMGRLGPIPGARVVAEEGQGENARTVAKTFADIDGHFALPHLSGRLTLRVTAPGFGMSERRLMFKGRARQEDFLLANQDAELRGKVVDSSSFPVRAASVRITKGPSGRGRRAATDEHGHFRFADLAAGSYEVDVLSTSFPVASRTIKTGGFEEVALEPGGRILVRLQDAHTNVALGGVRVDALGPAQGRTSVVSDANGNAKLKQLRPGAWSVRVDGEGYVKAKRDVVVQANIESPLTIELARGATLAGVLRDADGERVAGARVWVGGVSARTDQDGRFRLTDVPTGQVTLHAEKDESVGSLELELSPGDELVTLEPRIGSVQNE